MSRDIHNKYWDEELETMPREELEKRQLEDLQEIVKFAYENAPYYKRSFDQAGVKPEDIKTLKDIQKFPFINKKTQRDTQGVGSFLGELAAVPEEDVVFISTSSGSTGVPTMSPFTKKDFDEFQETESRWFWQVGMRPNDRYVHALNFSLYVGGPDVIGAQNLGALCIWGGTLPSERLLFVLKTYQPTVIWTSPSYAWQLGEKALKGLLRPVMEKLRVYMLVGGMPQAVSEYVSSGNIDKVERIKRGIIKLYREDIAKYAEGYVAEATAVFNAIPSQLSHHDKKIKFAALKDGGRFSAYADAIYWIGDSMVGNLCYAADAPGRFGEFSLQPSKVKCYMEDTGLLLTLAAGENYLSSEFYKAFMRGSLSINKGMMTENLVAQMLAANGYPLRFYEKRVIEDGKAKKYEVDFLLAGERKTTPVEVKSGNAASHSSLVFFRRRFAKDSEKGIVLTKGDLRITDDYRYLPLPMAMFL